MDNIPLPPNDEELKKAIAQYGGPDAMVGFNPAGPSSPSSVEQLAALDTSSPSETAPKEETDDENEAQPSITPKQEGEQSAYGRLLSFLKPQKSVAPMNLDVGKNATDDKAALQQALQAQGTAHLIGGLGKAGELIGSGIVGTTKQAPTKMMGTELFNDIQKSGDKALQDYQMMKEQQKDDPNSPLSKMFRQYVQKFGINVQGDFTASMGEKLLPFAFKSFEANEQRQARHEDLALKMFALQKDKEEKGKDKQLDKDTHRFDDLNKKLTSEIASSRSAFGRGANTIRSAEAIEKLAGGMDLNKLDTRQITEIARNLDAMLSSGAPTVSGMNKLIPKSAMGDLSKLTEYIFNARTGAHQASFLKNMLDTVSREKALARDQIRRTQGSILGTYSDLKKKYPEKFTEMLQAHDIPEDIMDFSKRAEKAASKNISKKTLSDYAVKHGITEDAAKQLLSGAGYVIE